MVSKFTLYVGESLLDRLTGAVTITSVYNNSGLGVFKGTAKLDISLEDAKGNEHFCIFPSIDVKANVIYLHGATNKDLVDILKMQLTKIWDATYCGDGAAEDFIKRHVSYRRLSRYAGRSILLRIHVLDKWRIYERPRTYLGVRVKIGKSPATVIERVLGARVLGTTDDWAELLSRSETRAFMEEDIAEDIVKVKPTLSQPNTESMFFYSGSL